MTLELQILAALGLDLLLGDPRWLPHPVRLIGKFAMGAEKISRNLFAAEKSAGISTVIIVLSGTALSWLVLVSLAGMVHSSLADLISIYILYTSFAVRDLVRHSSRVEHALKNDDLVLARDMVGMIVGRDTAGLDKQGVVRACVESVAENTVDGITAPLFWAIVGGPLGALLYKAVNTMDSIFGYKNEKYLYFGWAPARLDDLLNWLPARITGLMLVGASFLLGLHSRNSWQVFRRDRLQHASPNSGHAEAPVAGALGIRLGGISSYFGRPVQKPTIGDEIYSPHTGHIGQAQALLAAATIMATAFFLAIRLILGHIFG